MPYLTLVILVLGICCLVDVIITDEALCRNLPKLLWLLLVLFVPLVGPIAWLVAGRPVRPRAASDGRYAAHERPRPDFPEYDRPGRLAATDPEADERFLRQCRERAEEQRRKARGES